MRMHIFCTKISLLETYIFPKFRNSNQARNKHGTEEGVEVHLRDHRKATTRLDVPQNYVMTKSNR